MIAVYLYLYYNTMHSRNILILTSTVSAFSLPSLSLRRSVSNLFAPAVEARDSSSCPAVWNEVSKELTTLFLSDGQCNRDARVAIRLNFHDCGAWKTSLGATGGCDGSVVLNEEENARIENRGLQDISIKIKNLATKYEVSVAGKFSDITSTYNTLSNII